MSVRGRKPKHPGLQVLDGGRNHHDGPKPVEIPTDYPACPPDFEYPEVWGQVQQMLSDNGVPVRSSDGPALEDLVSLIAEVRAMRKTIRGGRTVAGDRNPHAKKRHPVAAQLEKARTQMWAALARFGMTPVDAARLPLSSKVKTPRDKVMEGAPG